jgi:hypothetical protein
MKGWKYTRQDGTDHHGGTVNYRENIGKEMVHPLPDMESTDACGQGYHLGKTLKGAGGYGAPGAVFRCEYSRRDVLGEDEYKVRVSRLTVLEEVPAWKGYGPRGKQVQAFIGSLVDILWFENVGKPFKKPAWCLKMEQVDSRNAAWDAARNAARDAARNAAWDAAWYAAWDTARSAAGYAAWYAAWHVAGDAAGEIMGGIKDGYFSRLMEVYRAGHYPVSFDGEKLVVY